jgi:hypothetical protein
VTTNSGIVTSQSGNHPESVTILRIRWSRSSGFTGHVTPDCPVTMLRNTHQGLSKTAGRSIGRFYGSIGTVLAIGGLSIALLARALF